MPQVFTDGDSRQICVSSLPPLFELPNIYFDKLIPTTKPIYRDGRTLVALTKRLLQFDLPISSAYRFIKTEKNIYDQEIKDNVAIADRLALHTPPNMLELSKAIEEAKESDSSVVPGLVDKMGRPYVFDPILYPKLISQLDEMKDVIGFGPVLVST